MGATLKNTLNKILDYFKNMEKARRTRFIVLAVIAIVFIVVVASFFGKKEYAVLYTNMETGDAAEVQTTLKGMGVEYQLDGPNTIKVEKDKRDDLILQLAAEGYPKSGFTYEIMKEASGLGATDFERNVYLNFQLQQNIGQTIKRMDSIKDVSVLIASPDNTQFVLSKDKKPVTATVVLELESGKELSSSQASTIADITSKSVSGLDISNVTIADTQGRNYSLESDSDLKNIGDRLTFTDAMRKRMEETLKTLLTPVFGAGNVIPAVNLTLNFDDVKSQEVVFTPPIEGSEQGIACSMETIYELIRNGADGDVVGFDPNGAAPQYPEVTGDEDAAYINYAHKVNYEINEIRTQIEYAKGGVKDLSVSVLLNSQAADGADYSEIVAELVANAIGVDRTRITISGLPFPGDDGKSAFDEQMEKLKEAQSATLMRTIIIIAACLIALLLVFFMVKTLVKKPEPVLVEGMMGDEDAEGLDLVADEEIIPGVDLEAFTEKDDENLAQLEQYIEKSPESVAQLLRNWLSDEQGR
ncbi:flagellar M-ring protein FliF [Clostridia bacterium OttesenSCG-928-F22]|nr:flagellar M-ring protein FliF [Clostridia bacterium OttesenSCG-928-F22]